MKKTVYELNEASIDLASQELQRFLASAGQDEKSILHLRLILEDALNKWKNGSAQAGSFTIRTGTMFGRSTVSIRMAGREIDPFSEDGEDDFFPVIGRLKASLGSFPVYSYQNGANQIQIKLRKKRGSTLRNMLAAILLSIPAALLGLLLPADAREVVTGSVLTPICDIFLQILSALAGPMLFFSITWGIFGLGDLATFERIGKKMFFRFCGITFLITACSFFAILPFAGIPYESGGFSLPELQGICGLLREIVPKDIVSPFLYGNTVQIIFMATVAGIIMLILNSQMSAVGAFVEQVNYGIRYLMEIVTDFVPLLIFVVIVRLIWSDALGEILTAWKPLASFLTVTLLIQCLILLYAAGKVRTRPLRLAGKLLPTFLIALTTSSTSASLATIVGCCEKDLGIDKKMTGFGVPLGIVLYKPVIAINFTACALYLTGVCGGKASVSWMLSSVLFISILAIAMPPIPGGELICYTLLLSRLRLPSDAMNTLVILNVFFDFFATGFGMTYLQCELLLQAGNMHLLDKESLCKASKRK